jgi:hypothetical protein
MKLRQIAENLMGQQLQNMFNANGAYFSRPDLQTSVAASDMGHDAGAQNSGMTLLPTGVPRKKRHRKFLGMGQQTNQMT